MHLDILSTKQIELLPYLKRFKRKFYLVGGTAIALHLGHRRSVDFDLFCLPPFNRLQIFGKIQEIPCRKQKLFEDVDQIHYLINDIKTTFFCFPYSIDHPEILKDYIRFPSLLTLSSMKAFALGRRAKWRDYVDLFFILKDHFSIEQISSEALKNFGQLYSEKLFREQLAFHKDIDFSEPIDYLVSAPSDHEIKQFLIDKALDIGI